MKSFSSCHYVAHPRETALLQRCTLTDPAPARHPAGPSPTSRSLQTHTFDDTCVSKLEAVDSGAMELSLMATQVRTLICMFVFFFKPLQKCPTFLNLWFLYAGVLGSSSAWLTAAKNIDLQKREYLTRCLQPPAKEPGFSLIPQKI